MSSTVSSDAIQIVFFGILSALFLRCASKKGYFQSLGQPLWNPPIQWYQVIGVFGLYFGISYFIMPLIAQFLLIYSPEKPIEASRISLMTWLNFTNTTLIFLSILACVFKRFKSIWRQDGEPPHWIKDLKAMSITLALAIPVILFCGSLIDLVIHGVFKLENLPDQIAVQWLKTTFAFPGYFLITAFTIIILAPLLEETLFRGFLQSFLRKHLGPKFAIGITAFCFSCFHFSWEQGWNNIPIITTLFPLALFLGYLYEKQRSLFASISMHASFNTISLINIYFFGHLL